MTRLDTSRAIATSYRRFEFRSRLEAKWAAFFDLCGWSWSYEPPEFAGWIPDFAIGHGPTLVEVKPFYREEEFAESKQKIFRSGCRQNVILLGADPVWMAVEIPGDCCGGTVVGWLLEAENDCCWPLHFGITEGNGKPGLCPMDGGWHNEIWGVNKHPAQNNKPTGKPSRVLLTNEQREKYLVENWAAACNIAKWVKHERS